MFIAPVFIIAQTWKQPQMLIHRARDKRPEIDSRHALCSVITESTLLIDATAWMYIKHRHVEQGKLQESGLYESFCMNFKGRCTHLK